MELVAKHADCISLVTAMMNPNAVQQCKKCLLPGQTHSHKHQWTQCIRFPEGSTEYCCKTWQID